jgi:hypothetical protein
MHVSQAYDEDIAKSSPTFWECSPPRALPVVKYEAKVIMKLKIGKSQGV